MKIELENSIIHPLYANQRGVFYSATDRWTDPYVALHSERHLAQPGQWVNLPICKTTVSILRCINQYAMNILLKYIEQVNSLA